MISGLLVLAKYQIGAHNGYRYRVRVTDTDRLTVPDGDGAGGRRVSLISKSPRIATNRHESPRIATNRHELPPNRRGANNPLRPSVAVCITSFK